MTSVTMEPRRGLASATVVEVTPHKGKPVVLWAVVGAFFVLLQTYVLTRWVLSDNFGPVPIGDTPVPLYATIAARLNEIGFGIAGIVASYICIYRPWRRDGKPSFTGLFMLAFLFVWWQDPLADYITDYFSYTSVSLNLGGFAGSIPGWASPNGGRIPPPLFIDLGFYFLICTLLATQAAKFWQRWRARNPSVSMTTMVASTYAVFFVFDFALEFAWCRLGLIVFPGATDSWCIFPDQWYKFPIYEPLMTSIFYMGFALVRYSLNDRGETIAERGASELRVGNKQRTFIRFLALVGILNVSFLATYNIPIQFWALHPGTWQKSTQEISWINHGMCGEGTNYACTNSVLPIARKDVISIAPDGITFVPKGMKLPTPVPIATGKN